jgi:vanillate/3-O-methylgallate O-demethylase
VTAPSLITQTLPHPLYDDLRMFSRVFGGLKAWEFNGWKPESMSWKTGCYIHAGLSGPSQTTFSGPEAAEFLSSICINGFSNFPTGGSKHAIMLTDGGLIAAHALLQRDAEDRFRMFAVPPWAIYQATKSPFDVQFTVDDIYLFQIAGPTSLQTLERATGEDLRDIGFLRFRPTSVDGTPTEICRIGMSGTLAYELRGPIAQGPAIYDAVVRAGADLGIQRLGWRTYMVNHVEAGFPQLAWTFMFAAYEDPGYAAFAPADDDALISGSVDPADMRARYRTPVELDWRAARFDHDFIGRQALEAEVADPKRTIATLRWNPDDVIDIYASLLRPGEEYKSLDLPTHPYSRGAHAHADHVVKDGTPVGISSGTIYSYYYREVISHCTIDTDLAEVGTEVIVKWGDFGGTIKDVRATVARYPYLDLQPNQTYDLSRIPAATGASASADGAATR